MKIVWLAVLPLTFSCLSQRVDFTLLQADVSAVGACDESALNYGASLCVRDVERELRDAILDLEPDVVALQGVLADDFCAGNEEADDRFVCAGDDVAAEPSQGRRLLGTGYFTTCGGVNPTPCLGVRLADNVLAEESGLGGGLQDGNALPEGCDPAFGVSRGSVLMQHNAQTFFGIIIGALEPSAARTECRLAALNSMFAAREFLGERVILTGSFNVDPANVNDEDAGIWASQVGDGAPFRDLSGTLPTTDGGAVVDHVASDLAEGTCTTLGESPETARLDGGSGTDHRAIFCALTMPTPPPNFE